MEGFIFVDKPVGYTSHDVVAIVRKKLSMKKVGHSGTLDPFATGLLIIAVGRYTKIIPLMDAMPKRYSAVGVFGEERDTEDIEGKVIKTANLPSESYEEFESLLKNNFSGTIEQIPPAYSALKVNGKRAYDLARKGEEVVLPVRKINIHEISLLNYDRHSFEIDVSVSRGTYIRSLVRDIGRAVSSAAYTTSLRRTAIGFVSVDDATSIDSISEVDVLPFSDIFPDIPSVIVEDEGIQKKLLNGDIRVLNNLEEPKTVFYDMKGKLLALAEKRGGSGAYLFVGV